MTHTYTNSIRWIALSLIAIGGAFAINVNVAQAQGFRRPTPFRGPAVGFNGFRTYAPTPIGINLRNPNVTPAAAQYLQATRTNIQVANAATRLVNSRQSNLFQFDPAANYAYSAVWNRLGPYGNPYWTGPYYPPYLSTYYYPQIPYYGTPYSYGAGYGSGIGYASYTAPVAAPPTPAPRAVAAVAAFGVATNDDGTIAWPFAFRMMSPDAKAKLLDPLAAQLERAASQAAGGKVNPNVVREGQQGVDRLYDWLRSHRLNLAEGSVRDANAFLGRIDAALRTMRSDT